MEPRGSLKNSLRIINPTRHPINDTEKKGLQLGSVVRVSVNPGLSINSGFFISAPKSLFGIIFSIFFFFFLVFFFFTASHH